MFVPQNRALDLSAANVLLDQNLAVVAEGLLKGAIPFPLVFDLADAHRGAQIRRLDEAGKPQLSLDGGVIRLAERGAFEN